MKVPDIDYQAEIKKCKTLDDIVGKNGLMKKLLKDVMQQLLEAEMDEHLGREKYERTDDYDSKNYRNGYLATGKSLSMFLEIVMRNLIKHVLFTK